MIKIENFDSVDDSGVTYGGHSGSKKGIIIDGERWFLKYPKSTKSMQVVGMSYTTAPISEYIGSHIYSLLGFETHDTKLGIRDGKIVVACKDFLNKNETILDYNSIKNDYNETIEKELEKLPSSTNNHLEEDLEEIIIVMKNNTYFEKVSELKDRFWDMFIVDAFINNNDRNANNWGLILNYDTMKLRISPVYDNGAAFYSKSSDEKIESILQDNFKMRQVIYDSCVSSFARNGKVINPLKFIEKMDNEECNKALLRVFPKIDMDCIKEIFDNIPLKYNDLSVLSYEQRELYYKSLEYKYEKVLEPVYSQLKEKYIVNDRELGKDIDSYNDYNHDDFER